MTRLQVEVSGNLAFAFKQWEIFKVKAGHRGEKSKSKCLETEWWPGIQRAFWRRSLVGAGAESAPAQVALPEAFSE